MGSPFAPWGSALPDQGSSVPTDGTYKDWLAATEFQGLKAEVECQAKGLESLSKEVSRQLLGGLRQVLREELALQVLQESVSKLG